MHKRPALQLVHDSSSCHQPQFMQLKSLCPCDGGCPRCTESIQPKLRIGAPDNKYELEADCVAEQVMQIPEPQVQRAPT